MATTCVNLRKVFGDRFRVKYEESYYVEKPEFRAEEAPWLMIIVCQHGHICPWDGNRLLFCSDTRGPVLNRVMRLPYVRVAQLGSDGGNVTFPVEHFAEVAAIVRPKRRKRLSPERRAQMARIGTAALRQYQTVARVARPRNGLRRPWSKETS